MELKFDNIARMVEYLDSKAIEHAQKIYAIELDHSASSIEQGEEILARLHEHYLATQSLAGIFGMAMFYGAYIGEAFRRSSRPQADWEGDASGRTFPCLRWHARHGGDSIIFPMSWCYTRIIEGPENNVWVKYQACALRDDAFVETIKEMKYREND